jgi:predicted ester cyclase
VGFSPVTCAVRDEFFAADFIDHSAAPGAPQGIAPVKEEMQGFVTAFPDLKLVNDKVIVKGDYVTVISTGTGTNTGPLMGMAPTGKWAKVGASDVWLVRDGKLAEAWHVEQMMMQLGVMGGTQ